MKVEIAIALFMHFDSPVFFFSFLLRLRYYFFIFLRFFFFLRGRSLLFVIGVIIGAMFEDVPPYA